MNAVDDARSSGKNTEEMLAQVRTALRDPDMHLRLVRLIFGTSGWAVQVYVKSRKVGPLLLAPVGGTVLDVLAMLDELTTEVTP